jgi:hypothetical protein
MMAGRSVRLRFGFFVWRSMMRLNINGQTAEFMPIQTFRQLHGLPPSFRITAFEAKLGQDLGRIDGAQDTLRSVQDQLMAALPSAPPRSGWSALILELQILFRYQLYSVNLQIRLKPSEIDYAVNGLGEVLHLFLRLTFEAAMRGPPAPDAALIYQQWLNDTTQVADAPIPYNHGDDVWHIRTVYHAYGRVGLQVDTGTDCYYVVDKHLACPAEGFMATLLTELMTRLQCALNPPGRATPLNTSHME